MEDKGMSSRKPDSSRLNLFYILQILSQKTDEDHPMAVAEIVKAANEEFGYLSATGAVLSDATVKRILDELVETLFPFGTDTEALENRYGYCIFCVMKKDGRYIPYKQPESGQPPKRYYYYECNLKEAELLTLKDAVETYNYFSEADVTEIVRKIIRLRPLAFRTGKYFDVAGREREEDSRLLMNIESLNEIIQAGKKAKITYCEYGEDKKLHPRPGYPKVIEPVHLMWSNGFYYLLAYNAKYQSIVNFRADRITDIEESEEKAERTPESFNPVQYRFDHPVMYGGERRRVVLLVRNSKENHIMNNVIDTFGRNIRVSRESDGWLKVVADTTLGGMELWAAQHCEDVRIIEPEESAERVKKKLEEGIKNYSQSGSK